MLDDHDGWIEDIGINEALSCSSSYGYIIMQFTGLLDKNGKEIYEGDIIRIISTGDIKKVFYHKCSFGIDLGNEVFAPIYWHGDVEVIGNIHEHHELPTY